MKTNVFWVLFVSVSIDVVLSFCVSVHFLVIIIVIIIIVIISVALLLVFCDWLSGAKEVG